MGGLLASLVKECVVRLLIESRHAVSFIPATAFHAIRCGFLPLKDRHVFTRHGRLRLRYVALMATAFVGLAASNLSFTPPVSLHIAQAQASIADVAVAAPVPQVVAAAATTAPAAVPAAVQFAPSKPMLANYKRTLTIESGDTLSDLLQQATIAGDKTLEAVKALKGHIDPRALKAGQDVTMHYRWSAGVGERLTSMEFAPDPLTRVVLHQGSNGAFKVDSFQRSLSNEVRAARAVIKSSLYSDLRAAGVPDSIIAEFIKTYSYNVDFQRDIWAGDKVEILYSVNRTDDGDFVRGDNLIYAALYTRGKPNVIFRFENGGHAEFFDEKGNPVKKALMRTPIDGARVTSGFGMRRHPIQGYSKMHKGTDFGAPSGTPIFAAGDGVVTRANWFSGYGKYVSIKHNGTYTTAYGHMSQINVKPGQRVRQGQVIGRVGSTGNSTGPHLHFEVIKDGAQINPIKVANISIGNKLGGKQLARFQAATASAKGRFETIISSAAQPKLASYSAAD